MADAAPTPAPPAKKRFSLLKPILGGLAGLAAGVAGMYSNAIINTVAKPARPVANFSVTADGLTVHCQNHATGDSGWWDFGDGTPLEPFDAKQPSQPHTYAKPGSYSVKLIVRNFLSEENERTVPVELSKPSGGAAAANSPVISNFSVEPIGGATTSPATFRVRGEVRNAERVIWDLGGEKLEVTDAQGSFEKLVVFERPGNFPIQLTGLQDRTAVKQAAMVTVTQPRAGSMAVLMRTIDTGSRIERKDIPETIALPLPPKGTKSMAFERTVPARPGFTMVAAKLGKAATGAVKNVKVELAPDRKAAKLTGEFTATGESTTKAAGGTDAMVSLVLTEEKSTLETLPGNSVAVPFSSEGGFVMGDWANAPMSALVQLPPAPPGVVNVQRKIEFQVREVGGDGRTSIIGTVPDLKLPLRNSIRTLNGQQYIIEAELQAGGQVRVVLKPVVTRGS
jgi:PKD repeat protein